MPKTYDVYYGNPNDLVKDENKLSPAPLISVTQQPNYADEYIIGYTYNMTLTGYITSIDNAHIPTNTINDVLDRIEDIRNIFNKNGATLVVAHSGNNIIHARGSKINNFTVDRSDNGWVNYAQYSVDVEFKEIDFLGCSVGSGDLSDCINVVPSAYASGLVDISKYKIKNFSDSWDISLNENIYNGYKNPSDQYAINNQHIEVSYSVQAEGINYYQIDGSTMPAWEQAKNFCQDKLYDQIKNGLISNILEQRSDGVTSCSPNSDATIDNLFEIRNLQHGNVNLDPIYYTVYNERITCDTSESNGSFSLVYNAIIKQNQGIASRFPNHTNCIHTFTLSKNVTDSNSSRDISVTLNGNIQGLMVGGLITNPAQLSLPRTGVVMLNAPSTRTKYDTALSAYNEITSGSDISNDFKDAVGINFTLFEADACSEYPASNQLQSSHNYSQGAIDYSVGFNSKNLCAGNSYYTDVVIDQKDPVDLTAEFIIPGRSAGPFIQKLNVSTPRTISISINGVVPPDACKDFSAYATQICNNLDIINDKGTSVTPTTDVTNAILTSHTENFNEVDGSFSINRAYTYYDYSTS